MRPWYHVALTQSRIWSRVGSSGGDWGMGISRIHIPVTHQDTPRREGDCQDSIQTLLKFDDCEVFAMISERSCLWNWCGIGRLTGSTRSAWLRTAFLSVLRSCMINIIADQHSRNAWEHTSISPNGLNAYFHSTNSKLSAYEGSMMLELAIGKSKIVEQTDRVINLLNVNASMKVMLHWFSINGWQHRS